ncbi:MAG: serine/threonine protein kinase [Acidobacteriota bacterium]|nr:serine/threonine protein kinase [Acidobacteriota bacterium]
MATVLEDAEGGFGPAHQGKGQRPVSRTRGQVRSWRTRWPRRRQHGRAAESEHLGGRRGLGQRSRSVTMLDIADALASAHAKGIVHRDLKPSNVMLTGSGVKLVDFGLARLHAPEAASDGGVTRTEDMLTSAGLMIGTGPYMSPEQVEGGTIDARSDIFSFGSVLYELLTGRRAFPDDSGRPPIAQILRDDPTPVSNLAPAIPADLASIVARCLRKDRARRYQNMADVKVALEDVRDALRSVPREQTSHAGRRWRLAGTLLLGCAVIAAGYLTWRATPDMSPAREVPLTTLQGYETSPTLAPDGEQVAFSWSGPNHDNVDISCLYGCFRRPLWVVYTGAAPAVSP